MTPLDRYLVEQSPSPDIVDVEVVLLVFPPVADQATLIWRDHDALELLPDRQAMLPLAGVTWKGYSNCH